MSNTFADLGVPDDLVATLAARGIDEPFEIQAATIPDVLAGRDVCGRAPTGSGKTIAFGVPLLARISRAAEAPAHRVVLAPTRELAAQICRELEPLAGPRPAGSPRSTAASATSASAGSSAAASTSWSPAPAVSPTCSSRRALARRGRDRRRRRSRPHGRHGLPARGPAPARPHARQRARRCCSRRRSTARSTCSRVSTSATRCATRPARSEPDGRGAHHVFWSVEARKRVQAVADVVPVAGPTIVFCRTRRGADRLAQQLEKTGVRSRGDPRRPFAEPARPCAWPRSPTATCDALVATDVAARGIHVDGVACVVHFDTPEDEKAYLHRSGRTARAGAAGMVVSFVSRRRPPHGRALAEEARPARVG